MATKRRKLILLFDTSAPRYRKLSKAAKEFNIVKCEMTYTTGDLSAIVKAAEPDVILLSPLASFQREMISMLKEVRDCPPVALLYYQENANRVAESIAEFGDVVKAAFEVPFVDELQELIVRLLQENSND
jgi:hypothetical protein